jgi:uncharacterized protein
MKTKPLTFLLVLTFLFLFSGSSVVFAWELGECEDAYLKQDYKTAHTCWLSLQTRLLTEKGWDRAQIFFGMMHELGQGISTDYKEAVKWYRLAAEQGNPHAKFLLGTMYYNGQGVPQDDKEAVKWFRLSAKIPDRRRDFNNWEMYKNGHPGGQLFLGIMYKDGEGVLQDYALAHMWFNLCGSSGNKDCVKNRSMVEGKMTPQQIEKAQEMARNWKPKK